MKDRVRTFCDSTLAPPLRESMGDAFIQQVKIHWSGIYKWSVVIHVDTGANAPEQEFVALLIGPTAQFRWQEDNPDRERRSAIKSPQHPPRVPG